jgi:hypothetical protein
MSLTEAAERWGLKRNTLIAALNRGRFYDQIKSGLVRKYENAHGKTEWYITKQAMEEVYGEEIKMKKFASEKELLNHLVEVECLQLYNIEEGFEKFFTGAISTSGSQTFEDFKKYKSYEQFNWRLETGEDVTAEIAIIADPIDDDEFEDYFVLEDLKNRKG